MLIEWFHYLTTPAIRAHRRLGYLSEGISLLSRSRRCRLAWADHMAAARTAIRDAGADLPRKRIVVVLGSGLLDDVPLDELAATFREVVLVDAVHLWPARLKARRHRNVRLVTEDLSGTGPWLLDGRSDWTDAIAAICDQDVDLVISANLLSQLPILPVDWIEGRKGIASPDLGRRIVEMHLESLARLSARVCLITDSEQIVEDRSGRVHERLDLLHGATLPVADRAWIWELAPFGEAEPHRRLLHRVHAYLDWSPSKPATAGSVGPS